MQNYAGKQLNQIAPLCNMVVKNLLTNSCKLCSIRNMFWLFKKFLWLGGRSGSRNVNAILREHWIQNYPLMLSKEMKKVERGSFDSQSDRSVFSWR